MRAEKEPLKADRVRFGAPRVEGGLGARLVRVVVQGLAADVLVSHRVARAAWGDSKADAGVRAVREKGG